jgi:hypothetical protein
VLERRVEHVVATEEKVACEKIRFVASRNQFWQLAKQDAESSQVEIVASRCGTLDRCWPVAAYHVREAIAHQRAVKGEQVPELPVADTRTCGDGRQARFHTRCAADGLTPVPCQNLQYRP